MARKQDDFDEWCDPNNPRTIQYEDVLDANYRASKVIDKNESLVVASHSQKQFGIKLYFKPENRHKTGSFKDRGVLNVLQKMTLDKRKIGVVIASIGNFGTSFSYYANKNNVPLTLVMPVSSSQSKIHYCHNLGTKVILYGNNLMDAQKYGRSIAKEQGLTFINSRDHPQLLAGYGSIGIEILEQLPLVDAVIVPVGCGGLVAAIASVIKHLKPDCLVYGVQAENSSPFFESLEKNQNVTIKCNSTMADGIAVPHVGINSINIARKLLDKMLLVKEEWIAKSIVHLIEVEKLVVEGAGACSLAALIGSLVPELKNKYVVCLLTGGNMDPITIARCMDRGLTAISREVMFSVNIQDTPSSIHSLFKLISYGEFDILNHTLDRTPVYFSEDLYYVKVKILSLRPNTQTLHKITVVCCANSLEHALELKRLLDRAYPGNVLFVTEPFNDKTICPCFVRKQNK